MYFLSKYVEVYICAQSGKDDFMNYEDAAKEIVMKMIETGNLKNQFHSHKEDTSEQNILFINEVCNAYRSLYKTFQNVGRETPDMEDSYPDI